MILGISEDEDFSPTYRQILEIVHPDDHSKLERAFQQTLLNNGSAHFECRIVRRDLAIRHVYVQIEVLFDEKGLPVRVIGFIQDITKSKQIESKLMEKEQQLHEEVKHISYHDHLTQLPNRRKFNEKLQQLTSEYANGDQKFAVMIIDIDHFKYINDTIGYPSGDELLCQIAVRLASLIPSNDMLARLGGDEFGVLVVNMESIGSIEIISNQIIDGLLEPFLIDGYELYVTVSIGISIFPDNGVDSSDLLSNADIALNKAEKQGESNYHIISRSSSIDSYKSYSLGRDIRKALENNEMTLHFQPRVDSRTGEMISAEALIRWEHPEWGLVSPMEFLPIAEENGLIVHIDDWVLREVCKQLRKWKEEQLSTVPISINISAVHFMKQDWLQTIEKTIQEAGIHPQDLEFEMTESSWLNNKEIVKTTMNSLKEMGITISLDDFGTGYSSLSYLTQFPFDVIKIDKSFIQNMIHSDQDMFIAKSIIYLAKGLQIKVVAEGVETLQQLNILKKEECHQIQGYLFSRPVPNEGI